MINLVSLSGPSGSGKSAIADALVERSELFSMIRNSWTTRPPRDSDVPGEQHCVSQAHFDSMRAQGAFLWTFSHSGVWYGTIAAPVTAAVEKETAGVGIMVLAPTVIRQLRDHLDSIGKLHLHIPVFIDPPDDRSVLLERMLERGDAPQNAADRWDEDKYWPQEARASGVPYHYIRNDGALEEAVRSVLALCNL